MGRDALSCNARECIIAKHERRNIGQRRPEIALTLASQTLAVLIAACAVVYRYDPANDV